ncbi:MAG: membrane integrity-associated transporter subunit PqiC [Propionivibrio sp.]|nr:membrane integrity-associated transporter subunit PqiC [Propionivibrio sp.]
MFRMLKISLQRRKGSKYAAGSLPAITVILRRALSARFPLPPGGQKILFPIAAIFLLAGCLSAPQRTLPSVYDFGTPAQRIAATGAWANVALDVHAPAWLDAPGIAYRLAYEDPLRWRNYVDSRWADSPVRLLGQQLRQQLGVMAMNGTAAAGCLLRVELQSFTQVFSTPQQSHGRLQAVVMLVDGRRQLLAERTFAVEEEAATPDAQGAVRALTAAGSVFGQQLAQWLEDERTIRLCKRSTIR